MIRKVLLALALGSVGVAIAAVGGESKERPPALEKTKKSKTPTLSISASTTSPVIGDSITLSWGSTNATSCTASGDWSGPRSVSGSEVVADVRTMRTFVLSCRGKKGSASGQVVVEPRNPPAPELRLTTSAPQVIRGRNVELSWTATNATECTAAGNWTGTRATSGQASVGPLTEDSAFELTCSGRGGTSSTRAEVKVIAPPLFELGTHSSQLVGGDLPLQIAYPGIEVMEDLDGDGRDDLIIPGRYYTDEPPPERARPGYVAFNLPGGFRADASKFPFATFQSVTAREFAAVDLNKDGVKDLFVADTGYDANPFPGHRNQLFLSQAGQPRWVDATAALPDIADYTYSVTTGDVDGDGNVDVLVGNWDVNDPAYFLMGDGKGGFTKDTSRLPDLRHFQLSASHLVDLDGDNRPELVLGTGRLDRERQVLWNESGRFTTIAPTRLAEPVQFGSEWFVHDIQHTDLNNDGRPDLIVNYAADVFTGGWQLQFLINEGDRRFSDQTARYLPYPASVSSPLPTTANTEAWIEFVVPRDLNADGLMDYWMSLRDPSGGRLKDYAPVALIRQADSTFKPITVGMLRTAGAPEVMFARLLIAVTGPGEALLVQPIGMDGKVRLEIMPISFPR